MVKHVMRTMPSHGVESFQKWGPAEVVFNEELQKCTANVHCALCGKYRPLCSKTPLFVVLAMEFWQ